MVFPRKWRKILLHFKSRWDGFIAAAEQKQTWCSFWEFTIAGRIYFEWESPAYLYLNPDPSQLYIFFTANTLLSLVIHLNIKSFPSCCHCKHLPNYPGNKTKKIELTGKQDGNYKLFLREKASFLLLPVYSFHLPQSKTNIPKPSLAYIMFV